MRDQQFVIVKSDSLDLLRYGGIIQRNCHFKIHTQFLIHGIDQISICVNSVSCNYTFVIFFKAAYVQTSFVKSHKRVPYNSIKADCLESIHRQVAVIIIIGFYCIHLYAYCLCDSIDIGRIPQDLMLRIVGKASHMRLSRQHYFFYKVMFLFIDHIDDRIMFLCAAVSTDQHIIFGNCQSLRSHGRAHGRCGTFFRKQRPCIFQSGNDISSIFFLFFSSVKGKIGKCLFLGKHLFLAPQRIHCGTSVCHHSFCWQFCFCSVYKCI